MIDRFCALGINSEEQLPRIDYPSLDVNIENISNLQFEFGIKEESKILALCPGAEFGPAKRWPSSFFSEVAQYYIDKNWTVMC